MESIKDVLIAISTAAPNAELYIAGYPYLFGSSTGNYTYDGNVPGSYKCVVASTILGPASVAYWDAEWLNSQVDELNRIIEDAVDEIQALNVSYVSPVNFNGHGLCDSGTSWINPVQLSGSTVLPESFHPNVIGMQYGYGYAFESAIY